MIDTSLRRGILLSSALLALAAAAAAAAAPAANPEYAAAVAAAGAWEGSLESYRVTAVMTIRSGPPGQPGQVQMEAELEAAARRPDRLLSRQTGKDFSVSLGVGPQRSWFYLGQMNACYVGAPQPLHLERPAPGPFEFEPARVFNFYAPLQQFLLPQDLTVDPQTRTAALTLDGREVSCQVFAFAGTEDGGESGEYWYDPQSHLVLKALLSATGERGGATLRQELTVELKSFALNEPVDEALFAFTPPAGARQADHLDRLTNPEAMTGRPAPEVTFKRLDGTPLRLADLRGKVVFLDFWATWCGPCKMEMPHIQTLHEEFGGGGEVVFLAASSEAKAVIEPFIARNGYTFTVVQAEQADAQGLFKAASIPTGFVIDKDGVIRAHMVGARTEQQLRTALARAGVGN